jgi:ferredoxin-NADP reductase
MCGPPPMMKALTKDFRRLGVPSNRVRREQFGER